MTQIQPLLDDLEKQNPIIKRVLVRLENRLEATRKSLEQDSDVQKTSRIRGQIEELRFLIKELSPKNNTSRGAKL